MERAKVKWASERDLPCGKWGVGSGVDGGLGVGLDDGQVGTEDAVESIPGVCERLEAHCRIASGRLRAQRTCMHYALCTINSLPKLKIPGCLPVRTGARLSASPRHRACLSASSSAQGRTGMTRAGWHRVPCIAPASTLQYSPTTTTTRSRV